MWWGQDYINFIYSEKATKFCKISTLFLSFVVPVKSKVGIWQNFVAFSEYMNFMYVCMATTCAQASHVFLRASIIYTFLGVYYG